MCAQRRVSGLERQLAEERRRVQAAEKKLKMVDVPLSEAKDDTRLRQHEKEILVQEVRASFYLLTYLLYEFGEDCVITSMLCRLILPVLECCP